ncbi:MAG: S8 family serine peptidase [Terricaulis sp.]
MGALALVAASTTLAFAGPGPGGGDDFDGRIEDADAAETGGSNLDDSEIRDDVADESSEAGDEDHSGPGGGDEENGDDSDGGDDGADSGSGDDGDNSGSGSGDDSGGDSDSDSGDDGGDNSGSGSDSGDDGGSNSGSGSGDDGGSSGSGGGDDNSGSGSGSGSGSSGHGGDDEHSGSGASSNSGSNSANSGAAETNSHYAANATQVEIDERGNERVAGEALLTGNHAEIEAAIQAGYTPISQQSLPSMDCYIVRLALPVGVGVDQAVAHLQELAPNAIVAANTIYHSSQGSVSATPAPRRARAFSAIGTMGVIDTGVDAAALGEGVVVEQRSFAAASPTAREHGSAVAALAASRGMRMHIADVFARSATGEQIASAESIAAALDWMMANNVAVINVSIEGPNNPVLQALVRRAYERGFVVVAAAGNGGPAARPAFPAAFEGSLAVTAIDGRDRPYIRANRGGYIDFAAHGVDISISTGNENLVVSGTSFSAPLVAAQIATRLSTPSPERAHAVVEELRLAAVDLGVPGRDPIFGWGAIRD